MYEVIYDFEYLVQYMYIKTMQASMLFLMKACTLCSVCLKITLNFFQVLAKLLTICDKTLE